MTLPAGQRQCPEDLLKRMIEESLIASPCFCGESCSNLTVTLPIYDGVGIMIITCGKPSSDKRELLGSSPCLTF